MEINITKFFEAENPQYYCTGIAETGMDDIGQITWKRAKKAEYEFVTNNNRQEFIDYFDEIIKQVEKYYSGN